MTSHPAPVARPLEEALATDFAALLYDGGAISPRAFAARVIAGPLAPLLAEAAALREQLAEAQAEVRDLQRTMSAWFDTSQVSAAELAPRFEAALQGYLRTCRCGGMDAEASDMAEAVLSGFLKSHCGSIVTPFIEQAAKTRATAAEHALAAEREECARLREENRRIRETLKAKAEIQVAFWRKRMAAEKSREDGVSEDGMTYTPIGDDAAWSGGYCNGRLSEADWWRATFEYDAAFKIEPPAARSALSRTTGAQDEH